MIYRFSPVCNLCFILPLFRLISCVFEQMVSVGSRRGELVAALILRMAVIAFDSVACHLVNSRQLADLLPQVDIPDLLILPACPSPAGPAVQPVQIHGVDDIP